MINYFSLVSVSSVYCSFISTRQTSLLIDAGIGVRTIKKNLMSYGISLSSIAGVLVTHDHADHIKAVGSLGERQNIPIYTTREAHFGINNSYCMTTKLCNSARYIVKEEPFTIGDFTITAFEVPHDSIDCVGYMIEAEGKTFVIATDVGQITPTIAGYLQQANYMVLEANYDTEMLHNGPYPLHLKQRILSEYGHLSNTETAEFLATHWRPELKRVWLCHLSQDNNHPELALKTVVLRMEQAGIAVGTDVVVEPLKRLIPTGMYEL